jgi:site-specific DNA-adenine methylase
MEQKRQIFKCAPLPFQGQKRMFVTEFRKTLSELNTDGGITTIIDLFGGSGLLAHTAKRHLPECRVIYNDYDNYTARLDAVSTTNEILERVREIVVDTPKGQRLDAAASKRVLEVIGEYERRGFVDYITLSSSLLFAQNYVLNYEALCRDTLYNKVRKENYNTSDYLHGLEVTHVDYKALFAEFRGRRDVLFLVDPPYLSTDTSTYSSDKYWRLGDYLDVLHVLTDSNYIYFTSNKSQIIELLEWLTVNYGLETPFCGATTKIHEVRSHTCKFTDMMLYKSA